MKDIWQVASGRTDTTFYIQSDIKKNAQSDTDFLPNIRPKSGYLACACPITEFDIRPDTEYRKGRISGSCL